MMMMMMEIITGEESNRIHLYIFETRILYFQRFFSNVPVVVALFVVVISVLFEYDFFDGGFLFHSFIFMRFYAVVVVVVAV